MSTVYLITGASRGIGLAIIRALAGKPDTVVYATARNPSGATELLKIAKENSNIKVEALESTDVAQHEALAKKVEAEVGKIDILYNNAGLSTQPTHVLATEVASFVDDFKVNVVGTFILFKAFHHLVEKSDRPEGGVFSVASTILGSIGAHPPFPSVAYQVSKAAVNMLVKKISEEHKDIIALLLHPGLVTTEMGTDFGKSLGLDDLTPYGGITPETSATLVIGLLDRAEKANSGILYNEKGEVVPW